MLVQKELKNAYIWIPNPTSIVLDKSSISLTTIWQTEQLTATIEPTISDHSVTWSSDDTTIATVSTTGLVTCVTPWTCTITATTVNGLTATCGVTDQWWQPWVDNIVYFALDNNLTDYTNTYTLTPTSASIINFNWVKCLDCTSWYASWTIATLPQWASARTNMFWVYLNAKGTVIYWYGTSSYPYRRYDWCFTDNTYLLWQCSGYSIGTNLFSMSARHHVALARDSSNNMKIYFDGTLVKTWNVTFNTTWTNIALGADVGGTSPLNWYLSNFIIEGKERTAQEVADYYDLTKSLYGIS